MDILTCRLPEDKPLAIAPLGDIQYGNEGCSLKLLKEHLEWIDEDFTNCDLRFIGTGDYIDLMSPSNRDRYKASGLYSSAVRAVDGALAEYVNKLAEVLHPHLEGKVTTLCRGHHWMEWSDDEWLFQTHPDLKLAPPRDSDRYLSFLLGSHLNSTGNLRRGWGVTEKVAYVSYVWPSGRRFNVLAFHGEGGGQTLTYTLNKLDKFAGHWDDIDAVIMGHTHKLGAVPKQKLTVDRHGIIRHRNVPLVSAGSFLKGYVENAETYVEGKQLHPIALGGAVIKAYPDRATTVISIHS